MNSIVLIDTPSLMDRENSSQKNASESEITMMENSFSAEEQVVQALKTDVGRQILSSQAEKHFELEVTDARYGSIIIQLSPKGGNSLQKLKQSCATGNIKDFLPNIFMGSGVENTLGEGDFRWKVSIYVTPYRHGGSSNKVDAIKIHWKLLVEEMNPWTLLADLQAKGLLGKDEEVEILKLDSRKDRMKFLLKRLLASKEPDLIFEVLLEHCQEHNEYVYQRILKIEGGLPDFYEHEELSAMADKTSETERESQSDQGMIYSTILILKICRKQSLPTAIHPGSDSEFEICHLDILEPVCYFDFEAELHKEEEDADDLQNEVVMVLEQVQDPLTDQASVGKGEAHKEEGDAADLQNKIAMVLKQVQEPLTDQASVGKGFALGNTIKSKTKGIWAWCPPHPVKKDEVLLLDTEGLGDTQKGDRNNDNHFLALALLLSSTVDYIILLKFFNDDLERLSFVTKIAENIKFSDKMSVEESGSILVRVFPTFILTMCDITLDLIHQGKQITSDEYLELVCLNLQPDTSPKIHKNMVRPCIRKYFKTRKCFVIERPGNKTIWSCLDDLEDKDLNEDFVRESQLFVDYVYNKCHPKQMNNGCPVSGRQFITLDASYVESIQKGKVEDAYNCLVNLEHTRAIEESVRIYQSGMNRLQYHMPDGSALFASHLAWHNDTLYFFRRHSVSDVKGYYYIVNKTDMLDKHLRETASWGQIIMQADEALIRKEKEMEVERQRIADVERLKQSEKSLQEETKRLHKEKIQMYQEALEMQKRNFADEIEEERIHLQKLLEQRLQEKKRSENEGFSKEAERVSSYAGKRQEELSEYHKEGVLSLFGGAVKKLFW